MADDAPTQDLSEETQPAEDAQPEQLRVHSLARVLGTTSKRVLDALTELDGRPRSAQSASRTTKSSGCAKRSPANPTTGPPRHRRCAGRPRR